ncbi:MAG: hypothetical protein WBB64_00035 [Anaerolineales bacterium]
MNINISRGDVVIVCFDGIQRMGLVISAINSGAHTWQPHDEWEIEFDDPIYGPTYWHQVPNRDSNSVIVLPGEYIPFLKDML